MNEQIKKVKDEDAMDNKKEKVVVEGESPDNKDAEQNEK